MLSADFGQDLNLPQEVSKFIKLKEKGDKVKFRIAATPKHETIHFLDGKTRAMCTKYNSKDNADPCAYCADYARAVQDGDKVTSDQIKPVTNFYYPILNLDTNTPAVFQFTAKMIHIAISNYHDQGVDVFACDWLVQRNEGSPANYYSILRLSETPLTDAQKEALEAAKNIPIKGSESSSVVEEEVKLVKEEVEATEEAEDKDFIKGLEKDKNKSVEDVANETFGKGIE